jgi:hypothetical protein
MVRLIDRFAARRGRISRASLGGLSGLVLAVAVVGCRSSREAPKPNPDTAPVTFAASSPSGGAVAVAASGAGEAGAAPKPPATPLTALAWVTEVRFKPSAAARVIGALRAGATVGMRGEPVSGDGCDGGKWAPVEPAGYVCLQSHNAVIGDGGEIGKALAHRPDGQRTMPYLYGISRKPGPIYGRVPSGEEAAANESGLAAHVSSWLEAKDETGAGFRSDYWTFGAETHPEEAWEKKVSDPLPVFLAEKGIDGALGRAIRRKETDALVVGQMKRHNGFSFTNTLLRDGRRYAVTPDLQVIPVDRVRPIEGSAFHGVRIPEDAQFPFAFVRTLGASLYRVSGKKLVKDKEVARRTVLPRPGKQRKEGKRLYYETKDGAYISDAYASRLDPAKRMPKWGKNGEHWLDVNITKQTIVAYDGEKAVYATLVSTGEAGLEDPKTSKATTRGIFRVHAKHVAATMDSDVVGEEFELRDIPYVQYFEGSYALHAAYWHDDFGTPRSHGCINLAPEDAKFLFGFTKPDVPPGFHSAETALTGSVVFVHP